jgi:hypothetical protein
MPVSCWNSLLNNFCEWIYLHLDIFLKWFCCNSNWRILYVCFIFKKNEIGKIQWNVLIHQVKDSQFGILNSKARKMFLVRWIELIQKFFDQKFQNLKSKWKLIFKILASLRKAE